MQHSKHKNYKFFWPVLFLAHLTIIALLAFKPVVFLDIIGREAGQSAADSMGLMLAVAYALIVYTIHSQYSRLNSGKSSFYIFILLFAASIIAFVFVFLRIEYSRAFFGMWIFLSIFMISIHFYLLNRVFIVKKYLAVDSESYEMMKGSGHYIELVSENHREIDFKYYDGILFNNRENIDSVIMSKIIAHECDIINVVHLYAKTFGKVPIKYLPEFTRKVNSRRSFYLKIKRFLEIIFCFILSPLFLLFFSLGALIILIGSGRPIFYKQPRVGLHGKEFQALKLRTMKENSDADGLTVDGDNRIIPGGKFLRSTRIDEIPQLINIMRGEMSLIGPRAEWTKVVNDYRKKIPGYDIRHSIKPGITGWAQVSQGHTNTDEEIEEKLERDLYYILHVSADLDILITLQTMWTVITRFGVR